MGKIKETTGYKILAAMSGSTGDSGKFGDKLEELDLTADEIHRLTEAMKKKEFRDLLAEYAKEIQDPENKVS